MRTGATQRVCRMTTIAASEGTPNGPATRTPTQVPRRRATAVTPTSTPARGARAMSTMVPTATATETPDSARSPTRYVVDSVRGARPALTVTAVCTTANTWTARKIGRAHV